MHLKLQILIIFLYWNLQFNLILKARKCELAVGTRENTMAGGTIVMDCGPNYVVVLDAPYESNTPLPIPIPGQATTIGAAVGYQVLWPTHLVNLSTKFIQVCYFHLQQFIKRRISFENMVLSFIGISKREKTKNKRKWIEKWWKPSKCQEFWCISRSHAKWGENTRCGGPKWCIGLIFKTFLIKEDMDMIISFKEVSANCVIYYIW